MKQLLRYFSVGLFSAGLIMLIALLLTDTRDVEEYTAEELIPLIEKDGYHVLNNEEYISMTLDSNQEEKESQPEEDSSDKENQEKEDSSKNDVDKKEKETKEDVNKQKETDESEEESSDEEKEEVDEVTNYTLNIEPGMVTSSISSLLEENNIIDDASEFTAYLDDNDYSLLVQIGTFKVNSDMSFYELAMAITR